MEKNINELITLKNSLKKEVSRLDLIIKELSTKYIKDLSDKNVEIMSSSDVAIKAKIKNNLLIVSYIFEDKKLFTKKILKKSSGIAEFINNILFVEIEALDVYGDVHEFSSEIPFEEDELKNIDLSRIEFSKRKDRIKIIIG